MNLTDEQIIKALECCVKSTSRNDCEKMNCPACKEFGCYYMDISDRDDSYEALVEGLGKTALDLIKRKDKVNKLSAKEIVDLKIKVEQQKAEIIELQRKIASCNAKFEALQEVKEQLEKDVFNSEMNLEHITYEYELLKQEKAVVKVEAIKEFAEKIKEIFMRYAHLHNYADQARVAEIEALDGTKLELFSVWDVLTLKKHEMAEYEEMNELQRNIETIANDRLLTELEHDFHLLVKEMVGE